MDTESTNNHDDKSSSTMSPTPSASPLTTLSANVTASSSKTPNNNKPSPKTQTPTFLRLPTNLRNKILTHALEPNTNTNASSTNTAKSLLEVSKQIQKEVAALVAAKKKVAKIPSSKHDEGNEVQEISSMLEKSLSLHAELGGDNGEFERQIRGVLGEKKGVEEKEHEE